MDYEKSQMTFMHAQQYERIRIVCVYPFPSTIVRKKESGWERGAAAVQSYVII